MYLIINGDLIIIQNVTKSDQEVQLPSRADVAAASRPKKAIMTEIRKREKAKAGKPYKPTKQESTPNTYINWKSPTFWPLIDQAAKRQIGKPNLSALVKQLQQQDSRFKHLSHRRIGEWRDSSIRDRIVWSKGTLDEVKKEFLPGGTTTRFDAFVSIF